MLSDTEIAAHVADGSLRVSYSALPRATDGRWEVLDVALSVGTDVRADAQFNRALVRSRVAVTLGPLLKPLVTSARVKKVSRFAEHKQVVDLRTLPEGWALSPGQSVVAFTNECVELPPDVTGLVLSRVSNYNNGLVVTASYLDSCWHGIIKLHISNHGGRAVRMKLGEELARLFLFETDDPSPDTGNVATQGIHYGYTWSRILGDGFDPFPTTASRSISFRSEKLRNTNELVKDYSGYGLIALFITCLIFAGSLYSRARSALSAADDAKQARLVADRLAGSASDAGAESTVIPVGKKGVSIRVSLRSGMVASADQTFAAAVADLQTVAASTRIEQRSSGSPVLVIQLTTATPQQDDLPVTVRWLVVP